MSDSKSGMAFQILARFGYGSRGLIYVVVGGLALMAAFNMGGETTDAKGAILTMGNQPFGAVALIALSIGLVCYSVWRTAQVIFDMDDHGTGIKGIAIRGGLAVSAITHLVLAHWTAALLIGAGDRKGKGESQPLSWLDSDWIAVTFFVIGAAIIGAGIAHLYKAWTSKFEDYFDFPSNGKNAICWISQFGLAARGVVWCMIGFFILRSVIMTRRGEMSGIEEALNSLASSSNGHILLIIAAAGLFAFGVYSFLEARFRKVENPLEEKTA